MLPDEKIYAIVDHATPHGSAASGKDYKPLISSGADAGKVFGFIKVRLKLQNITYRQIHNV